MSTENKIYPLFSYPVMIYGETFSLTHETEYIKNLKYIKNYGNRRSQQSNILNHAPLASLKKFLMRGLNDYAYKFLNIYKKINQIYITQSWSNVTIRGETHHPHVHTNSIISGVFYLEGDKTPIEFHRLDKILPLTLNYKSFDIHNAEHWWVQIELGKVFLFPSALQHSVVVNETDTPRVSIAFNTFVSGRMGEEGNSNLLHCKSMNPKIYDTPDFKKDVKPFGIESGYSITRASKKLP